MTARATFRQSDLKRALETAREAGLPVTRFRITADGEIVVDCAQQPPADDFDLTDMRR